MKILAGNIKDKEGIKIICKTCGCLFEIESKKDFEDSMWVYDGLSRERFVAEYEYVCPVCNRVYYIGHNYKENKYLGSEFLPSYNFYSDLFFDREDWNTRYALIWEDLTEEQQKNIKKYGRVVKP